ncbi:MAG TPA: hypothetical protein VG456_28005 [Candidatus Sulfopaludibacter sp.]|nr:hypothetical protein [Candidatus Sulfopaludibacter sp.]
MIKLYKSLDHPNHWIACVTGTGWVAFPKTENGWNQRHPARGLDPLQLREVPLRLAGRTGAPLTVEEPQLATA